MCRWCNHLATADIHRITRIKQTFNGVWQPFFTMCVLNSGASCPCDWNNVVLCNANNERSPWLHLCPVHWNAFILCSLFNIVELFVCLSGLRRLARAHSSARLRLLSSLVTLSTWEPPSRVSLGLLFVTCHSDSEPHVKASPHIWQHLPASPTWC